MPGIIRIKFIILRRGDFFRYRPGRLLSVSKNPQYGDVFSWQNGDKGPVWRQVPPPQTSPVSLSGPSRQVIQPGRSETRSSTKVCVPIVLFVFESGESRSPAATICRVFSHFIRLSTVKGSTLWQTACLVHDAQRG